MVTGVHTVNTKSEDDDARHNALAELIRTFTDYGEYANAEAVVDYLKKETPNKNNQKLIFLNQAYLYQQLNNYDSLDQNNSLENHHIFLVEE